MRYFLFSAFLISAAAGLTMAQTDGNHGNAQPKSAEELRRSAIELEAAVKQQPGNAELHIRLGFTYTKLEKADEARQAFETAARLDPAKAIAHYMLGLIYEKQGLKDKAIASWKRCLETADEQHMRSTAQKHLHHLGSK